MNPRRLARTLALVLDLVVLTASGVYLIVYLYRWEWNRAVVSGIFFLIAQIALVAIVLLNRLAGIERRLDADAGTGRVPAEAWRADQEVERPFAWLTDGEAVFVPVLIGVGAILSAVAYVVEHLASATSPPLRGTPDPRIRALEPPGGSLAPRYPPSGRPHDELDLPRRPPARGRVASGVLAALVGILSVVATVNLIAGLTQNRPDPLAVGSATAFELRVFVRDEDVSARRVADALWVSCRANVPHDVDASLEWVRGSMARLRLEPAIGHNARRRFVGCLEDLTVEGALAQVARWEAISTG